MKSGEAIPAVEVTAKGGERIALNRIDGPVVIYFYPKDDTSGCTREAKEFSDSGSAFRDLGVRVIGISKDGPASHAKFAGKHDLTVELASDEDGSACEAFGVWGEKTLYGKTYMGIERATFLFDAEGTLIEEWRNVRVAGHVDKVLKAAQAIG